MNSCYLKLLESHLKRILNIVDLESSDRNLPINLCDYRLFSEKNESSKSERSFINQSEIKSYSRNEPRLELIKGGLERALQIGGFYHGRKQLSINAFRLKNLAKWSSYMGISAIDAIGALSSECNCDCEFCHAKTLPISTLSKSQLSLKEAKTRIKYYSIKLHSGLPPVTRLPLEPFSNRFSVEILKLIRNASPDELITLETNGSFLTEKVISGLSETKPIFLIISLNGVEFDDRKARMREPNDISTQIAMRCPELLNKYKIPFAISYVPWHNRDFEEIKNLTHYAESVNAVRARVCLPVVHKFAHPDLRIDVERFWEDVTKYIQNIRPSVNIPIGTTPTVYEWQTILPVVCGTVKDSPSSRAGIKYGDIIIKINGENVITRREARSKLAKIARSSASISNLTILRDNDIVELVIQHNIPISDESYPYCELMPEVLPFGIDLPLDIGLSDVMVLQDIIEGNQGKIFLLLLPQLAFNAFHESLSIISQSVDIFDNMQLYITDVKANYFGGNWVPARWWTVSDIITAVENWREQANLHEDIIILPAGIFSAGGMDILGNTILKLENHLATEIYRVPMSSVIT